MRNNSKKGTVINNETEFRELMAKKYTTEWRKASIKQFYSAFGEPEHYPFILIYVPRTEPDIGIGGDDPILTKVYF